MSFEPLPVGKLKLSNCSFVFQILQSAYPALAREGNIFLLNMTPFLRSSLEKGLTYICTSNKFILTQNSYKGVKTCFNLFSSEFKKLHLKNKPVLEGVGIYHGE